MENWEIIGIRQRTFEALQIYIDMNFEGLRDDILSMIAGETVPVNTRSFTNDMTTFRTEDDVLTLVDSLWAIWGIVMQIKQFLFQMRRFVPKYVKRYCCV